MRAGTGATRFVAGAVENDVDRFYVTLAMTMSDARVKRDVVRVGQFDSSIPLYRFKYRCNDMASIMRGTYPGPGITLGPALVFARRAVIAVAGKS